MSCTNQRGRERERKGEEERERKRETDRERERENKQKWLISTYTSNFRRKLVKILVCT